MQDCSPSSSLPGYLVYGQGDLALFTIRAAPEDARMTVPSDGAGQASMLCDEPCGPSGPQKLGRISLRNYKSL